MKHLNRIIKSTSILVCLLAVPAAHAAYTTSAGTATSADAEAVTGGTFLNINNISDTRNGLTLSAVALGANMTYSFTTDVNWSLNDSSDGSRLVGGRGVEDNNRRQSVSPFGAASWNPFSVTLSGLTPNATYGLKVVALGVRADTGGGQVPGLLDATKPDFGVDSYDFSYGASAGSMTTFPNVAAGTLVYEEKSGTATSIDVGGGVFVNHYYWKGAYACDIGNWTANGTGQLTLFLGEGEVNTFLNGARTQLDGIAVTLVPEPSALSLLGLSGLALVARRRR